MEVDKYDVSWLEFTAEKISYALDSFLGVERQNFDRESIALGLKNSSRVIKPDNDAYRLEAERLAAINTFKSKGFSIIDITPGLLTPDQYSCSVRPSWLFDGVNFLQWLQVNDSPTRTLRSVDFEIPGNFLKIEFINEINNLNNTVTPVAHSGANYNTLGAAPKYDQVFEFAQTPKGLYLNLSDGGTALGPDYYDVFSRKAVWITFNNQLDTKPHIVKNGDSYNTYFSSFTIHCSVGAPKIRITIGEESTITDGPSEAPINSQLHLTGLNSLMKNLDQVLQPFVLTDANTTGRNKQGAWGATLIPTVGARQQFPIVACNRDYLDLSGDPKLVNYGYSVMWITQARFKMITSRALATSDSITFKIVVSCGIRGVDAFYYSKQYISVNMTEVKDAAGATEYTTVNFTQPIRVVVPPQSSLNFEIDYAVSGVTNLGINPIFELYGYSLGGIVEYNFNGPIFQYLIFTKFITDASILDDYTTTYMTNVYATL